MLSMLAQLTISQFTLVEHLTLDFKQGMTVITGETGAGKSITLDALNLVLGARSDSQMVRQNANKAMIIASFNIDNQTHIQQWLNENDLATDENECLLQRSISKEGRSKAMINGFPVSIQQLKNIGNQLVDMQCQHAHHQLLHKDYHATLLDNYAGIQAQVKILSECFQTLNKAQKSFNEKQQNLEDALQRRAYLEFQLAEFKDLAIQPDEYQQLDKTQQNLANQESIQSACQQALLICKEEENSLAHQLQRCINQLNPLHEKSTAIAEALQLLETTAIHLDEASASLKSGLTQSSQDQSQLGQIESRLACFHDLARKHRTEPSQLIATQQQLQAELEQIDQGDAHLAELSEQITSLKNQFDQLATQLTQQRKQASQKLAKTIQQQLQHLGMAHCKINIALNTDQTQPNAQGFEHTEFLVSTNPGQPFQPLQKIASGGELSRISLAIQVVNAKTTALPLLVFDEVDVGIGGGTAEVVGQLMHQLATNTQIISITHQPQVASQADHHLLAVKHQQKDKTFSMLNLLNQQQRIEEIARMLGGIAITEKTKAHAREMLESST